MGEETKILKRGHQLGQGVGALKRGGTGAPYKLSVLTLEFPWVSHNFQGCKLVFSGFSGGKLTNLKIPGFFLTKQAYSQPCLFWIFSGTAKFIQKVCLTLCCILIK